MNKVRVSIYFTIIALTFGGCSVKNGIAESEDGSSSIKMSSPSSFNNNSSQKEVSSSSIKYSSVALDTIPLAKIGTIQVGINDGRTGAASNVSTVSIKGVTDSSITVEFNALDSAMCTWAGGCSHIEIKYDLKSPYLIGKIRGVFAKSVEIPIKNNLDGIADVDPHFIGFSMGSNEGLGFADSRLGRAGTYSSSSFTDSNNDGLIYNLSFPYDKTNSNPMICVDGLCNYQVCETSACEISNAGIYFFAGYEKCHSQVNNETHAADCVGGGGSGTFQVNGLSLIVEK